MRSPLTRPAHHSHSQYPEEQGESSARNSVVAAKTRRRAPAAPAIAIVAIAGAQLMVALDVTIENIASGAYNMFFQIGGAIGLAALTTVATTAIRSDLSSHPASQAGGSPALGVAHALAHGWGTAFEAGTGFAALALLTAVAVVRVRAGEIDPAHAH